MFTNFGKKTFHFVIIDKCVHPNRSGWAIHGVTAAWGDLFDHQKVNKDPNFLLVSFKSGFSELLNY